MDLIHQIGAKIMGKITLDELVEKRIDIEAMAAKNGVRIMGVFGSMVGGQDFTPRLDGKAWDIQLLLSPLTKGRDFDKAGFEVALEKIFEAKGEITIICLTEKNISLSVDGSMIFQSLGDNILETAKKNTLDHLTRQFLEQQTSAHLSEPEVSVQFFFLPGSKQLRINAPQEVDAAHLLQAMRMLDEVLRQYIEGSPSALDEIRVKQSTDASVSHASVDTTSSLNKN